jgi:prepilin-type N-terminal cleavage/methylation domain-containing protein/prepilin-type processing-associated H-X9-DG protein
MNNEHSTLRGRTDSNAVARRAFTLIELLVVVAIIVLLIGLLLPALRTARDVARSVVCSSIQKQFGVGLFAYGASGKDYIPGLNTSNADYQIDVPLTGNRTGETPTSTFDWITPLISEGAGLSSNRAMRTKQIFERFGCAGARLKNDIVYPGGGAIDMAEFTNLQNADRIGQISFLSPVSWHYYPNLSVTRQVKYRGENMRHDPFTSPVRTVGTYSPNLNLVGTLPSQKVFSMDGTRYYDESGILDFDPAPNPMHFGSFTDSGPIFHESTAYGRWANRRSPTNHRLSFRHGRANANALYFDGSVRTLTAMQAWTDASLFYPSGSTFTGGSATPESRAKFQINSKLP